VPNLTHYTGAQLVRNSLSVSSSGFLGSFSNPCPSCSATLGDYIAFYNDGICGDEIDLMFAGNNGFVIAPGINTVNFSILTF
jgi:hypothetical protein